MLVVKMESVYHSRAKGITRFICEDGEAIESAIQHAITSGEAQQITAKSTGTNEEGILVAEMFVTWSFKSRNSN